MGPHLYIHEGGSGATHIYMRVEVGPHLYIHEGGSGATHIYMRVEVELHVYITLLPGHETIKCKTRLKFCQENAKLEMKLPEILPNTLTISKVIFNMKQAGATTLVISFEHFV